MKKARILAIFLSLFIGFAVSQVNAFRNLLVNGVIYIFPDVDEEDWGQNVTDWAVAMSSGTLQKAGGTFTLTADAYFGPTYGLRAVYFKSASTPLAQSGEIRLSSDGTISWRNFANTGDFNFKVNTSTRLTFNGAEIYTGTDVVGIVLSTYNYAVATFENVARATAGVELWQDSMTAWQSGVILSTQITSTNTARFNLQYTTNELRMDRLDTSTAALTRSINETALWQSSVTLWQSGVNTTTGSQATQIATNSFAVLASTSGLDIKVASITANPFAIYDFVIGTDTTGNPTFYGTDQTPFNNAIAWAGGRAVHGFVKSGTYTFTAVSTIPANMTLTFSQGSALTSGGANGVIVSSGTLNGVVLRPTGGWAGAGYSFLMLCSSSVTNGVTLSNGSLAIMGADLDAVIKMQGFGVVLNEYHIMDNYINDGGAAAQWKILTLDRCINCSVDGVYIKDRSVYGPNIFVSGSSYTVINKIIANSKGGDSMLSSNVPDSGGNLSNTYSNFKGIFDTVATQSIQWNYETLARYEHISLTDKENGAVGNLGLSQVGAIVQSSVTFTDCNIRGYGTGINIGNASVIMTKVSDSRFISCPDPVADAGTGTIETDNVP